MHSDSQIPPALNEDSANAKLQERLQRVRNGLFDLAWHICNEIRQFKPDLVIVLAHGGWGALWAAQALWKEVSGQPFPRVLVTNLGREKLDRYEAVRSSLLSTWVTPFMADYAGDHEVGFFLAWLTRQADWQEALRKQVLDALEGEKPARLLVLDETINVGGTYRLALGLLREIFPECTTCMLAGQFLEWQPPLAGLWLLEHGLDPAEKELHRLAYKLIAGTEDAESEWDWRPITPESQVVRDLSRFLPAETWLELPGWAKQVIQESVAETHRLGTWSAELPGLRSYMMHDIKAEEIVMKYIWLHGQISRREAAGLLHISPRKAGALLGQLVSRKSLLLQGRGRGACYILPPDASVPNSQQPARPLLDAYWVEPGRLMVGEGITVGDKSNGEKQITWLLSQGIRCWINLDEDGVPPEYRYVQALERRARRFGVTARYRAFTLPYGRAPSRKQVQAVMDAILQALEAGQPVYLHETLQDLPSAIGACYLVSKGLDGKQALEALVRLRQDTYQPWLRIPAPLGLRKLVRRWGR